MVHPYNKILHSNEKEQNTDMHNNMNIKCIMLSKEARLKRPHIVLLLLYDILEKKQNCIDKKTGHGCQGLGC